MKAKTQNENQQVFAEAAKLRVNIQSSISQQLATQIVTGRTITKAVKDQGRHFSGVHCKCHKNRGGKD